MGWQDCSCGRGFARHPVIFKNTELVDLPVGQFQASPAGCMWNGFNKKTIHEKGCRSGGMDYPANGEYVFDGKSGLKCNGCLYGDGCRCDNSSSCPATAGTQCGIQRVTYKGNDGACCLLGGGGGGDTMLTAATGDSTDVAWDTVRGDTYTCNPNITNGYLTTPYANCGQEVSELCARQDAQTWQEWSGTGGMCSSWCNSIGSAGYTAAATVLDASLSNFHTSFNTVDQPNNVPAQEYLHSVLGYCDKYPGACDAQLDKLCSTLTREDIEAANNVMRSGMPTTNSTNIVAACGCHLPPAQYTDQEGVVDKGAGEACDPICMLPGAIKVGTCSDTGCTPTPCEQSVCEMDNISVSIINSNAGNINFDAICGNCPSGTCKCVFDNISIHSVGSNVGNIDFAQNCGGGCQTIDPSTNLPIDIDCTTGKPLNTDPADPSKKPPPSNKPPPAAKEGWYKKYGKMLLIGLGVIIAILFVVIIISATKSKGKNPSAGVPSSVEGSVPFTSTPEYKEYIANIS